MMERREQRIGLGVGAFLNPPRANYSEDTRKLIRVLMEESKLSMIQRKSIEKAMDRGESLPPLSRATSAKAINTTRIIPSAYWKRRSQESILNSGAYEREQYRRTTPLPNKEKQKRDLAYIMAYGKNMPETPRGPKVLHKEFTKPDILQNDDIVNDLILGIRERMEFLKEMEHLGLGKKYQAIIYQEIAEKMRIIDSMDSKMSLQIKKEIGEI
ncbi:UPF0193 protein EVG1 homolog [Chelonus insularis]|uniref:UPF0193 protein EVG1 homolog n=1 Tax=Chelonus insularis TaxID=460826 RepID=UPI00158CB98F|nr:UPF0193 protein EVG1 homolog [Chelonus insularis]